VRKLLRVSESILHKPLEVPHDDVLGAGFGRNCIRQILTFQLRKLLVWDIDDRPLHLHFQIYNSVEAQIRSSPIYLFDTTRAGKHSTVNDISADVTEMLS